MIGSVHGCVSCPVVVKPWEPHPLRLPQHPHPQSAQPTPQPFPQRSSSVHPWPPLLTQDPNRDASSHPRTSSPKLPEDDKQELHRFRSEKEDNTREKEVGSPLFLFPSRHGYDNPAWRKPSSQLDVTSDLDSSANNGKNGEENGRRDSAAQAFQELEKKEGGDASLVQGLEEDDSPRKPDNSKKQSKGSSQHTTEIECAKNTIQPEPSLLKGGYKSRGTQTPPAPATPKTKQDTNTQTPHPGPLLPESASASSKGLPKLPKTKAPLRSAWKPEESLLSHQGSLRKHLPALPKPKPLKARWDQLPRRSAGLPHKQTLKKSGESKQKSKVDSSVGPDLSAELKRPSRVESLAGEVLSTDLKRRGKTDSFILVASDNHESLNSNPLSPIPSSTQMSGRQDGAQRLKDVTQAETGSIGTPAWLRQLTLPSFPASFYGSDSGSKSGSLSYETSETVSQNNLDFLPSSLYHKESPEEQSFESSTVQSSESDLATPPAVPPEVDALTTAAAAGDLMTVKKLLKGGVDVNATNSFGRTAIQVMTHDNPDLAEMLMKAGADPNTCDVGKKAASSTFRTIAHDVAASGYTDTLRCLLRHGADLNLQDRWGNTPLHLAAKAGHLPAVRLLRRGTSLHTPNQQGKTPIAILEEFTDPAIQQWVQLKKGNASRLQTLCILAIRKQLGPHGLRRWCHHAPDPSIQRQVLLQCRSPPPIPSASTVISNRLSTGSKLQKIRGRGSGGSQSLMAALTSRQLLDFLTLRDLIPRRLSVGENTSLEVHNTSSIHSSDDVLSWGPQPPSSMASDNGSLFDTNLSSIDASHSADDVSLPSFDQSL